MIRLRHKLLIQLFRIFDQVLMVAVFILVAAYAEERGRFDFVWEILSQSYQGIEGIAMVGLLVGWYIIFAGLVRYDANRFSPLRSQLGGLLKATTVTSLMLLFAGVMFDITIVSNKVVALFWGGSTLLLMASRVALRSLLMTMRSSGMNSRHIVFVGETSRVSDLVERVNSRPELGYRVGGYFRSDGEEDWRLATDPGREGDRELECLGGLDKVRGYLEKGVVDEVMVCLSFRKNFETICEIVQLCRDLGVVVRLVPNTLDVGLLADFQLELFDGDQVITFFREKQLQQLFIKRTFDVVASAIGLIILSPLLLLVAFLIKVTSKGPIFFVQERVGMNKRKFKLLKFRSMVVDAEDRKKELADQNEMDGPVFKIKDDPRVTWIGSIIRKFSIDELPQLINVLKGEMSLVGPRPPLPSEVDIYGWTDRKRLSMKPGITCLWQVSGRNEISFEEWMELDRQYVDNWSLGLDFKILFKTVPVVLLGKGAY